MSINSARNARKSAGSTPTLRACFICLGGFGGFAGIALGGGGASFGRSVTMGRVCSSLSSGSAPGAAISSGRGTMIDFGFLLNSPTECPHFLGGCYVYGCSLPYMLYSDAGWSSSVARRAHNPKVAGSNPAPATIWKARKQCVSGPSAFRRRPPNRASMYRICTTPPEQCPVDAGRRPSSRHRGERAPERSVALSVGNLGRFPVEENGTRTSQCLAGTPRSTIVR